MKKIIGYFVVFIFLVLPVLGEARDFYPKIFADINREAKKSVVQVLGGAYLDSKRPFIVDKGTGFYIGSGLFLTAYHVVMEPPEIAVRTLDGKTFPVEVVAYDSRDIAILKIREGGDVPFLPIIKLGDSSKIEEGDMVMAIGHPFGLRWTFSTGVVSAIREGKDEKKLRGASIQIDASINPGNSGGPLLNLEGEVVGIIVTKIEGGGIAFAVPINVAKEMLEKNEPAFSQEQNVSK